MKKNRRKRKFNRKNKRLLIVNVFLVSILFIGIGYSLLSTNLDILGSVQLKEYIEPTLYNVLKKEAQIGTYAKEYTGNHQDSMDASLSTEKIYHWWANNNQNSNTIKDKWNVIFANHCWQMIRTTDTGGVKMIYNGEVEDGKCLNTRGNHVGYTTRTTQPLDTTYYYGTSYTYDKTNNLFSLDGTLTTGTIRLGQYTCKSTTDTGTCSTLYLVGTLSSGSSYYVIPLNGNSHYSQFGILQFNPNYDSPADVGYMYNIRYAYRSKKTTNMNVLTRTFMSSGYNYYYGTGVTYDTSTNKYTLTGTTQNTWANTYSSASGLYTCMDITDAPCSSVYYIAGGVSTYMYGFKMTGGNLLNYYNTNIVFGSGYTESNGTYTLSNTTTMTKADWFSNYATYKNYYTCGDDRLTCNDMKYVTTTYGYFYYYISIDNNYIYAKDFTYNAGTGKYKLGSDRIHIWETTETNIANWATHHYTCLSTTDDECSTLSYVYYAPSPDAVDYFYYINLTNGKSVEDALNEMLSNNNVNQTDSIIKTGIDAWYNRYMTSYTSKLEDTIFCNDRSLNALNGWNPNGGNTTISLSFKNNATNSDLSCTNITDKFSVDNNKAKLTFSVGLMTLPEKNLLNNFNIIKTGNHYWLLSPDFYGYYHAYNLIVGSSEGYTLYSVHSANGVRPVISLKPGIKYLTGDGSMASPYVINNDEQVILNKNGATNSATSYTTVNHTDNTLGDIHTLPEREYTVSFDLNSSGGSATTTDITSTYNFTGWYTDNSGTTRVANNASIPVLDANVEGYTNSEGKWIATDTKTLYAGWSGGSITLPTITKSGSTCYWNTSADGKGTSYPSGSSYSPTSTGTLYAMCFEGDKPRVEIKIKNAMTGDSQVPNRADNGKGITISNVFRYGEIYYDSIYPSGSGTTTLTCTPSKGIGTSSYPFESSQISFVNNSSDNGYNVSLNMNDTDAFVIDVDCTAVATDSDGTRTNTATRLESFGNGWHGNPHDASVNPYQQPVYQSTGYINDYRYMQNGEFATGWHRIYWYNPSMPNGRQEWYYFYTGNETSSNNSCYPGEGAVGYEAHGWCRNLPDHPDHNGYSGNTVYNGKWLYLKTSSFVTSSSPNIWPNGSQIWGETVQITNYYPAGGQVSYTNTYTFDGDGVCISGSGC